MLDLLSCWQYQWHSHLTPVSPKTSFLPFCSYQIRSCPAHVTSVLDTLIMHVIVFHASNTNLQKALLIERSRLLHTVWGTHLNVNSLTTHTCEKRLVYLRITHNRNVYARTRGARTRGARTCVRVHVSRANL